MKLNEPVNMLQEEQLKVVISDIEREQEEAKKASQQQQQEFSTND